jgi:hypothetical protein
MLLDKFFLYNCFFSPICNHIYMNKLWKIYFWFVILVIAYFFYELLSTIKVLNLNSLLLITDSAFTILALYSYINNKKFFSTSIWAVYFYLSIIYISYDFVSTYTFLNSYLSFTWPEILQNQLQDLDISLFESVFLTAFATPFYLAMYRISKNKFLKQ